jgi:hypothetical protein
MAGVSDLDFLLLNHAIMRGSLIFRVAIAAATFCGSVLGAGNSSTGGLAAAIGSLPACAVSLF